LKRKLLLAVVAAAVVGVLAWDLSRPPAIAPVSVAPIQAKESSAGTASAAFVAPAPAAIPVGRAAASNFLRPASVSLTTSTPLARDFAGALVWKPFYDRLKGSAEGQSPEGQYVLYRILRACATVADRKGGTRTRSPSPEQTEERRQLIATSLPEGDPRVAQRLAAFDKVNTDQCAGLSGVTVTEADLAQMLGNAVAGGDPKARAWQVEQEMWQERRAAAAPGRAGATLSDSQLATLRESFVTKDPEAMVIAGRVLANGFRDITVRVGPDQEPIENRTFMNAALLLACEHGYPCGENSQRVLSACAFQGHCGVASLPDYLFYYGASPYDAQLLDRYRTYLRQAADSGDWSAITVQRGSRSPNATSYMARGTGGH
jgi:hypothetical protein